MTVTPAKLAANRANAKKSTGPRTERGKRRSSMNGVTHGMFCVDVVLPGEDAGVFEQFRTAVLKKLSPQDVVELMLCDRIVVAQWKLRRLNALEANACRVRSSLPIDRAKRCLQRDRDKREYDALTWGKKYKPTARDRETDRVIDEYEQECATSPIRRLAPSEMPADECDGDDHDREQMERWSRLEQRLELSIHRNLRSLERLRRQSQSEAADEPAQCPFVPEVAYELDDEPIANDEQIEQSEAKEKEDEASSSEQCVKVDAQETRGLQSAGLGAPMEENDHDACVVGPMRLTPIEHHATPRET